MGRCTLAEVDCRIDPEPCGLDFPDLEDDAGLVPATRATLKIDDDGLARLNCSSCSVLDHPDRPPALIRAHREATVDAVVRAEARFG